MLLNLAWIDSEPCSPIIPKPVFHPFIHGTMCASRKCIFGSTVALGIFHDRNSWSTLYFLLCRCTCIYMCFTFSVRWTWLPTKAPLQYAIITQLFLRGVKSDYLSGCMNDTRPLSLFLQGCVCKRMSAGDCYNCGLLTAFPLHNYHCATILSCREPT